MQPRQPQINLKLTGAEKAAIQQGKIEDMLEERAAENFLKQSTATRGQVENPTPVGALEMFAPATPVRPVIPLWLPPLPSNSLAAVRARNAAASSMFLDPKARQRELLRRKAEGETQVQSKVDGVVTENATLSTNDSSANIKDRSSFTSPESEIGGAVIDVPWTTNTPTPLSPTSEISLLRDELAAKNSEILHLSISNRQKDDMISVLTSRIAAGSPMATTESKLLQREIENLKMEKENLVKIHAKVTTQFNLRIKAEAKKRSEVEEVVELLRKELAELKGEHEVVGGEEAQMQRGDDDMEKVVEGVLSM